MKFEIVGLLQKILVNHSNKNILLKELKIKLDNLRLKLSLIQNSNSNINRNCDEGFNDNNNSNNVNSNLFDEFFQKYIIGFPEFEKIIDDVQDIVEDLEISDYLQESLNNFSDVIKERGRVIKESLMRDSCMKGDERQRERKSVLKESEEKQVVDINFNNLSTNYNNNNNNNITYINSNNSTYTSPKHLSFNKIISERENTPTATSVGKGSTRTQNSNSNTLTKNASITNMRLPSFPIKSFENIKKITNEYSLTNYSNPSNPRNPNNSSNNNHSNPTCQFNNNCNIDSSNTFLTKKRSSGPLYYSQYVNNITNISNNSNKSIYSSPSSSGAKKENSNSNTNILSSLSIIKEKEELSRTITLNALNNNNNNNSNLEYQKPASTNNSSSLTSKYLSFSNVNENLKKSTDIFSSMFSNSSLGINCILAKNLQPKFSNVKRKKKTIKKDKKLVFQDIMDKNENSNSNLISNNHKNISKLSLIQFMNKIGKQ